MGLDQRGCVVQPRPLANWSQEEPVDKAKPFDISKRDVWEAFKRVKANRGAAGVDGQTIADFEANLSNSLYKLWNRLSSGSYFPLPVRRVDIPKADGGTRPLGIPTVVDRIAQEVIRRGSDFLIETPNPDGSWGGFRKPMIYDRGWSNIETHRSWTIATTGLAVMALMDMP